MGNKKVRVDTFISLGTSDSSTYIIEFKLWHMHFFLNQTLLMLCCFRVHRMESDLANDNKSVTKYLSIPEISPLQYKGKNLNILWNYINIKNCNISPKVELLFGSSLAYVIYNTYSIYSMSFIKKFLKFTKLLTIFV